MSISASYDAIAQCNRCGFCQVACPIFRSTGHESGVARGRLALLRAIIENRLEWSDELEEPLYDCMLCGGLHEQLLSRDPHLGAGDQSALGIPRQSRAQIHPPPAVRQAAAVSPAAASGRPGRSPGQEQRHERTGSSARFAAPFSAAICRGRRRSSTSCRRRRFGPVSSPEFSTGRAGASAWRILSAAASMWSATPPGRPPWRCCGASAAASTSWTTTAAVCPRGHTVTSMRRASWRARTYRCSRPEGRRHRHRLFELHRLHQEIPASLFRRRSAPPGSPIGRRSGQRRLGVADGRSHSGLQGAAGQTRHVPRPLPRLARSRPSETAAGAAASDAGSGVR